MNRCLVFRPTLLKSISTTQALSLNSAHIYILVAQPKFQTWLPQTLISLRLLSNKIALQKRIFKPKFEKSNHQKKVCKNVSVIKTNKICKIKQTSLEYQVLYENKKNGFKTHQKHTQIELLESRLNTK